MFLFFFIHMYKELYIQSKIIILITLNQINFCTQQNATHFLTGNLTQQFKVHPLYLFRGLALQYKLLLVFFRALLYNRTAWIPSQKRYIQRASFQAIKGFTDTISPPDQANLHAIRENQYPSSQTTMNSEESNKHALV